MKYIKILFVPFLMIILSSQIASADQRRLVSNTLLDFDLPSQRWEVSIEPPELAIEAMYVDLVHGKKKKGEDFDPQKLRAMAADFMQTNNLYVFNPETEAYLMVSISPFKQDSGPPGKKEIRKSAEWAMNAITEHAEVEDLASYKSSLEAITVPGLQHAVKVDADFPLFGEPHHFIGIIGYAHPYWVFMYYNDKKEDPDDLNEMRRILSTIEFDRIQ